MPNIKSAKKRVNVIATKTELNKAKKSALRTSVKKAELSLAEGAENSAELVRAAIKTIDKAAASGIIHANAAARKKSSLACKLNKIG